VPSLLPLFASKSSSHAQVRSKQLLLKQGVAVGNFRLAVATTPTVTVRRVASTIAPSRDIAWSFRSAFRVPRQGQLYRSASL